MVFVLAVGRCAVRAPFRCLFDVSSLASLSQIIGVGEMAFLQQGLPQAGKSHFNPLTGLSFYNKRAYYLAVGCRKVTRRVEGLGEPYG
jgi:hypothetical protein